MRWFAFVIFGFALFVNAGNRIVDSRLEPQFAGDSMLTRVRIADFPKMSGAALSMLVEPIDDRRLPARSRVSWYEPTTIPEPGSVWDLELRLRRPYGTSNPGLFSLEDWMFREKLHATGYVVPGKRNRPVADAAVSWIESYRRDFVGRAVEVDGDSAPVLAAVGVGARHLISREQWDRYAVTGTSHLMAISGLHVGLAASAAFLGFAFVSGACRMRGNHLDHGIAAAMVVATMYAVVSGFAVPSQRATLMLGLAAIAFLRRRRAGPSRIVAAVALLIYVVDPIALMVPGFSLSFAAVVTLLWFAQSRSGRMGTRSRIGKILGGIRNLAAMQVALLFGLMPLTALIFHRIAFVAPLANIVTVPIFSFVTVPLTLASMAIQPLSETVGLSLLRLASLSIHGIERVIDEVAGLPGAGVDLAGIGGDDRAYWCFVFLPAVWVLLPRGWPGRWIAPLGVVALLLHGPALPPRNCFDAHVLDVGQGLAVLVQSREGSLVFDTGASYRSGGSAAERILVPYLRYRNISQVDWLVVSHADDDHAGGVSAMLDEIAVGQVITGEPLQGLGRPTINCVAGRAWRSGSVVFRVLYPVRGSALSGNDSSCVLSVSVGERHLVLTGDIEKAGEKGLLEATDMEQVDAVLIPHHGSLTSSGSPFVNRMRPDIAIASSGFDNRWGFPKERVVKRWEGAGARVLETATSGAISFRMCNEEGISLLREERERRRRFWHDSGDL